MAKKRETAPVVDDAPTEAVDRIRVHMVALYTDATNNVVQRVALEQLIESPFNPRTSFDQESLRRLATTIADVGVMQAILVRPVDYAQLSHNGQSVQAYEIVYGHRRYRASKIAGVVDIPCIVRELTDDQIAQLQSIENVQREDLNPMEAARSYQRYLIAHKVSKDQLADEIGLSRTHVYTYLKFLTAPAAIQDAVEKGEVGPDVAGFIARLHTPKLQERALAAIKGKYYDLEDGGKKSVRQIREFLREKFTLKLSEAIFDTKDAQLLAGADACTTCPKRTGNAPEFQDLAESRDGAWHGHKERGEANLCTDPDCWEAKKKASLKNKAEALEAKGKTVITGNKARQLVSATGELKGGYIPLKNVKDELAKSAGKGKKKDDAPEVATVTIQNPRDGKLIEVVAAADLKAAGVKVKASSTRSPAPGYQEAQRRYDEDRRKKEEKALAETRVNSALLMAVRKAAATVPRSTFDLQLVAMAALAGVRYNSAGTLALLHGVEDLDELRGKVGQMGADQVAALLLDCALVDGVAGDGYNPPKAETLHRAAKHYGIDVAEIRKEVAQIPLDVRTSDLLKPPAESKEDGTPAGAALAGSPQEPTPAARAPKKAKKAAAAAAKQEDKPGDADASQGEGTVAALAAPGPIADWFASLPAETTLKLQGAGVVDRDGLADLAVDELIAITGQAEEEARALIVKAREAWFPADQGAAA